MYELSGIYFISKLYGKKIKSRTSINFMLNINIQEMMNFHSKKYSKLQGLPQRQMDYFVKTKLHSRPFVRDNAEYWAMIYHSQSF